MNTNLTDVENRLWSAADELRANSRLKASEYSIPVLGLIFLRSMISTSPTFWELQILTQTEVRKVITEIEAEDQLKFRSVDPIFK